MKLILGFLKPDQGEIQVCGQPVVYGGSKTNRQIGYLPDVPEYYPYLNAKEYLTLCGQVSGMSKAELTARAKELLHLVGLEGVSRRIRGYSRGMKQRLGLAQALLNRPRLLICDEPTSALDPVGRKELLDLLSVAREETTVVFSTHILSDVERVCDSIGILEQGRLVLEGKLAEIKDTYRQDAVVLATGSSQEAEALARRLKALPLVQEIKQEDAALRLRLHNAQSTGCQVLSAALELGIPIFKYEVLEPTLENVFLEVVQ